MKQLNILRNKEKYMCKKILKEIFSLDTLFFSLGIIGLIFYAFFAIQIINPIFYLFFIIIGIFICTYKEFKSLKGDIK